MSWTRRSCVRIGSALGIAVAIVVIPSVASAGRAVEGPPQGHVFEYQGKKLTFTHVAQQHGGEAVGVEDIAFRELLRALGASLTWNPGEHYVLVTTPEPTVIAFSVGDRRYDIGRVRSQARFAPFLRGREVYLPMDELLRALSLAPVPDGKTILLEPQLTSLDVRSTRTGATLIAHAGASLHARVVGQRRTRVVYEFDGIGSTLTGTRRVENGGVRDVVVRTSGTALEPRTFLTIDLLPGAVRTTAGSDDGRDFSVSFASSARMAAAATPVVTPASSAPLPGTRVTAVDVIPASDGFTVAIAVRGNASFQWHQLAAPDNRFWIDIADARLTAPPRDDRWLGRVTAVRVDQNDPTTVRIALASAGSRAVSVLPSQSGVRVVVGNDLVAGVARTGSGTIGRIVAAVVQPAPVVTEPPVLIATPSPPLVSPPGWKFGGTPHPYVPTNPHLIIIDPGHGGSDPGVVYDGVKEKTLTLDMALRLRDILVARGWQVRMTRTDDRDVFAPDDSAHDELQARVDYANEAGARLFVSIHVNAFVNSGPSGTTTFYSKPEDLSLAQSVEGAIASEVPTKDDDIVKSHLYVTLHTYMPAVLVETAFLTNPGDLAHLTSPQWRQRMAEAMADGIEAYARANPPPTTPPNAGQ